MSVLDVELNIWSDSLFCNSVFLLPKGIFFPLFFVSFNTVCEMWKMSPLFCGTVRDGL